MPGYYQAKGGFLQTELPHPFSSWKIDQTNIASIFSKALIGSSASQSMV